MREISQGAAVIYNATHAPYERWPEILPRLQENMIESAASVGAMERAFGLTATPLEEALSATIRWYQERS